MPKLVHKKQNFRELGFIPLHTKVLQEIRTPCNKCGKWIYVVKLGFCRFRFVGNNCPIEQNISALPWNNGRIITRIQNHDQLHNRRQNNENRVCITNLQRQKDRHKLKSTLESI